MTVEKRRSGSSGLSVAPLALGGNVFGWTADEKTSFGILDAFVDAGGNMIDTADVYSAWVPGNQGRRERDGHRQLAEARSGQARQGRHCDQGRILIGEAASPAEQDRGRLRCVAPAARDRYDRPLLPAQGRPRPSRSPTASARWTRWRRRAKSARSVCRNIDARAARRGDEDGGGQRSDQTVRASDLVQYGRARASWRARCATLPCSTGWASSPSTASPTVS